jgi:hypothetical protein
MAPKQTPNLHVKELLEELQSNLEKLAPKQCKIDVIITLVRNLNAYIAGTLLPASEQGVKQRVELLPTQRVSNNSHPPAHPHIQRVSNISITPLDNNLTLK